MPVKTGNCQIKCELVHSMGNAFVRNASFKQKRKCSNDIKLDMHGVEGKEQNISNNHAWIDDQLECWGIKQKLW
jgi:hypothetical protein